MELCIFVTEFACPMTLRKQNLTNAHRSKYIIHPGEVKMYKDLKRGILVARTEERRGTICILMYDLSEGKG
jgi:hypothetical protein